jgi:hypothetical protein
MIEKGTSILIIFASVFAFLQLVQKTTRARRDKKIAPPKWAQAFWHLVPDYLLYELTSWDWEGIKASQQAHHTMYCSTQ